jgi:acetyl esterase
MPLDPEAAALLTALAAANAPKLQDMTPAEARLAAWGYRDLAGPPEPVAQVVDRYIPGPGCDLHVRIYRPSDEPVLPALVHFHGSGWVIANLDIADVAVRAVANRTGCVIVAVNYRKAPEHPFPAPLQDCIATTQWVHEHADELGVDPERIGVFGDSAGGNLAAATCLWARDHGGPPIATQVLLYPVTDHHFDTASYRANAEGYLLEAEGMKWFWRQYLADPADGADPLASPLRAPDLSDLPPAYVMTAEYDPLRDEGDRYAERLTEAGVPVTHSRYDGMVHGFFWLPGTLSRANDLYDEIGWYVRQVLAIE